MRAIVKILSVSAMLLGTTQAIACKILVKYPDHLEISSTDLPKYYVVRILKKLPSGYESEIKQSFGGQLPVGSIVSLRYRPNEEAHAICPNEFKEQESYLIHSDGGSSELTISRYNWLNVPTSHEKYFVYVQDIAARASR
ncbi:hypothetical protein [Chitiniphilus eburneus]|uniref:Uncharacterized protein n=1 Tax=Chitiniphilus eburneus TaxID=2571148 RepID=A0A4U0PYQ1_9NEIS|nr:hypothetical protein [Chitiniphilus eburneus]TJZ68374.1 hypothetical protein FAZ21_15720 [Chitiniphilus eburneus]